MDKDERAAVTVVVVSYNAAAQLPRCLDALSVQTATGFDVIVVDNASIDGSVDIAADHPLAVTLIRSDKNLGFAAANNLAAKQARGEWIALLNPDAYPEPDWLDRLLAARLLLLGSVRNVETRCGLLLTFDAPNDDAVMQRTNLHYFSKFSCL